MFKKRKSKPLERENADCSHSEVTSCIVTERRQQGTGSCYQVSSISKGQCHLRNGSCPSCQAFLSSALGPHDCLFLAP